MKVYSGGEGSLSGIATLRDLGLGRLIAAEGFSRGTRARPLKPPRMVSAWKRPVPGVSWCLDNGAFSAWQNRVPWDEAIFVRTLAKVPRENPPDFAVAPDIVAGGTESLLRSLAWMLTGRLPKEWPWYLAVQNGMRASDVAPLLANFDGLFVGGTMPWKLRTAPEWVRLARDAGKPTHIGRIATFKNLVWAERIGAASVDSTTWARNDRYSIVEAARKQGRLAFAEGA